MEEVEGGEVFTCTLTVLNRHSCLWRESIFLHNATTIFLFKDRKLFSTKCNSHSITKCEFAGFQNYRFSLFPMS